MYISIIILNYNNSYDTINCIKSVLNYNTYPVKFIVVDNGSPNLNVIEELDFFLKEKFQNDYAKFDEFSPQHSLILKKATFLVSNSKSSIAKERQKGNRLHMCKKVCWYYRNDLSKYLLYFPKVNKCGFKPLFFI